VAGEIARAFVRIVPNTTGFQSSIERSTAGVGKSVGGKIGKAMAVGIGGAVAAAAGGLAAATTLAIGFDKSMRNVNSIAQLNEESFKALEKQVLDLGRTAGVAPKTLADGLYDVVSSGFKAKDAMKILTAGAKAAKAGLTDTATATGAVTAVLNAYHKSASDAGEVSDALFQTVNVGVIDFQTLAQNIGDVLPFASTLGVSIQDVGASIATLTKEGISGAETMTRIKAVMTQFISPSKDLAKAIKDQGFESGAAMIKSKGLQGSLDLLQKATHGNLTEMGKLFPDVRALGGALALTGKNSKSANADLVALAKSQGATSKAAEEQAKSISAQWDKAIGKLQASAITLGTQVLPVISDGIGVFSDLTDKVSELAAKPTLKLKAEFVLDQITSAAGSIKDAITGAIDEALNGTSSVGGGRFNNAIGMVDSASLTQQLMDAFNGVDWGSVGTKITDGIKTALTAGEDVLGPIIAQMNAAVAAHAGDFANTGALILANMVTTLTDPGFWAAHWQLAIGVAIAVFPAGKLLKIGELFLKPFASLGARIAPLMSDAGARALVAILGPLETFGGRVGRLLVSGLLKLGGAVIGAARFLGSGIIEGVIGLVSTGSGKVRAAVSAAVRLGIIGAISAAVGAAHTLASRVISGVSSGLSTLFSAVVNAFNGVKNAIANAASSAFEWAKSVGVEIVQGIASGIRSLPGTIASALSGLVTSALSHARSLIKSGSPSRLFADEVGLPIAQGIALGIVKGVPAIKAALTSAGKSALADAKANMNSLAGGLGDTIGQIIDAQVAAKIKPLQSQLNAAQARSNAADIAKQRADLVTAATSAMSADETPEAYVQRVKDAQAQLAAFDEQQRQQKLQDQIDAISAEGDARKEMIAKNIADLTTMFNLGKITGKQFNDAMNQILAQNKITLGSVGSMLGFAFAQQFKEQLQDVNKQVLAIAAVIGMKGGSAGGAGFHQDVTDPLSVIREQLRDARGNLKQDQRDLRDARKTKTKSDDAREKAAIERDRRMIATLTRILRLAGGVSVGQINLANAGNTDAFLAALSEIAAGAER